MKKIAVLVETTQDRAVTVKSGSTVFRVPQQQRVPSSAAEEFCVQVQVHYHECVRGKSKDIFFYYLLINYFFMCQCREDKDDDPDSLSPH